MQIEITDLFGFSKREFRLHEKIGFQHEYNAPDTANNHNDGMQNEK